MPHKFTLKIEPIHEPVTKVVIRLCGQLVASTIPALAREVEIAETGNLQALYFDMERVEYLDSRGVGAVLGWHTHFSNRQMDFRLLNVGPKVMSVFRICNLTTVLNIGPRPDTLESWTEDQRQALWSSYEYSKQIVAALGEGLVGVDPQGKISFVNPSAEKMLGMAEQELLGRSIHGAIRLESRFGKPLDECENPLRFAACNGQGAARGEVVVVQPPAAGAASGERMPVEAVATVLTRNGNPVGMVVGLTDIRDRVRAEQALRSAARLEATATLAAGIAHDFNNLMVGVLGNAELLASEMDLRGRAKQAVEQISLSARQASDLAEQIVAYARMGKREVKAMNLRRSIEETLRLLERSHPLGVRIETRIAPDLWNIMGDPAQMAQIVKNFCLNAIEAVAGAGHIVVLAENAALDGQAAARLGEAKPGRYVLLSVRDNGSGMAEETRQRVFEPFFSTRPQGRGLGLAAVYGIVKNHGGHIEVESEPGKGSTFRVWFEATDAPLAEREKAPSPSPKSTPSRGGETILLVDDQASVRAITQTLLERAGYRVLIASNGKEALDLVREHPGEIHLALLDVDMPVMNAAAAFPLLKQARPSLKVIICSGYVMDEATQELLDAGADRFLPKPFRIQTLEEEVRSTLDSQARGHGAD